MKYVCLICIDETTLDAMSPAEYGTVMNECLAYEEELRRSGRMLAVEALQPVRTAATVRVRDGRRTVTDGPFAETKEHVAGFFLIDAADLNEALDVAAGMPQARFGSIDVRPVRDLASYRPAARP